MKSIFFIYTIALFPFLLSCNSNEPDGGPCTYDNKVYPATVISIEKKDSLYAELLFRIEDESGKLYRDSVSWFMENKHWLKISDLKKDSITPGKKYKYRIDLLKSGSCNPNLERLTLEKY